MCYLSVFLERAFCNHPPSCCRTLLESCMSGRRSSLDVPTSPRFSGTKAYIFNNTAFRSSPLSLFLAFVIIPAAVAVSAYLMVAMEVRAGVHPASETCI